MIEIVIKIPKEIYTGEQKAGILPILVDAIGRGIPLPEHHGRLIDADDLREDFKTSKKISFVERMDISCIVDHAPTIIEADKESESE